jgi:hypothetical protein
MATIVNPLFRAAPATLAPAGAPAPAAAPVNSTGSTLAELPVFQTIRVAPNSEKAINNRTRQSKQTVESQRQIVKNMENKDERYAAYGNPVNNTGQAIVKRKKANITSLRNTKKYSSNYIFPRLTGKYVNHYREFNHVANTEANYNENGRRTRDPSEKLNFIRRIWLTARDVTHKQNYDDVIGKYQRILKVDPDDVKDSELDLFVAAPDRKRTWKNRLNPFSGARFATPELTKRNMATIRKGTRKINKNTNFKRQGLMPDAIRQYQLNAYNELLGIMLILMEKARDKYSQINLSSRLGLRSGIFSGMFSSDKEGILHIDNLQEDYVLNIFGYNLQGPIFDLYTLIKKHNPSDPTTLINFIKKHPRLIMASTLVYIVTMSVLFGRGDNYKINCPPDTTVVTQGGGKYTSGSRTQTYCKTVSGALTIAPIIHTTHAILTIGTMTAQEVLSIALAHGIPTAAMLTYQIYKMHRGYKRKTLLKDIFIDIHKVIFNPDNTMKFDDAKEFVFVYNDILSDKEREIFDEYGPLIDHDALDQEMYEYLTEFLQVRTANLIRKANEALQDLQEVIPRQYSGTGGPSGSHHITNAIARGGLDFSFFL